MAHATLTVNLDQIKSNINQIKKETNAKILLIAKANAYGLGANKICSELKNEIDGIGLASITEAISIRKANIKTPILLLSEPTPDEYDLLNANDIAVTVYNQTTIKQLNQFASQKKPIKTHFKIDTGMSRLGACWDKSKNLINEWLEDSDNLLKEGFYTHFANSELETPLNEKQLHRFNRILNEHLKTQKVLRHCANSGAVKNIKNSTFEMIRIGLSAYTNSITLTAPIKHIKTIKKGTAVGYGSKFIASETTTIAVIGMGYADGLPSQLANNGHVIINNKKCAIIGKICMDMFMVKIPQDHTIKITDTASIINSSIDNCMCIQTIAETSNQNPREVMCHFSNRLNRLYFKKG